MSFRLLPRDPKFFELFIADGDNLAAAARALNEMVEQYDRLDERVAEIQALEKRGDEIDSEITRKLEDAFVTPFDREDIHELVSRLDDVVDGTITRFDQRCAMWFAERAVGAGRVEAIALDDRRLDLDDVPGFPDGLRAALKQRVRLDS